MTRANSCLAHDNKDGDHGGHHGSIISSTAVTAGFTCAIERKSTGGTPACKRIFQCIFFYGDRGTSHSEDEKEASSSKALQDDTKKIPVIPGLTSGMGKMIYAGSIGTQIANELIDSYRINSPSSGISSPFGLGQEKCPLVSPQTSRSPSSREEASGSSSQSQSDVRTAAGPSSAISENAGEPSQLDLDSMVVPGLSSFSSDEAAMAVIWSLLETEGQSADFEDLHWPF